MDFNEIKIYDKKNLSDLIKEIHKNTQNKEEELKDLIKSLKPYIKTPGDAVIIVPLISNYINASIKNDDNLIKLAGIIQRAQSNSLKNQDDIQLSDEEKEQLLKNINNIK